MDGYRYLGKNDFDSIAPFRQDPFFHEVLDISEVPRAKWLRQQFDAFGGELPEHTDELRLRLLERAEGAIRAHKSFVRLDFDNFTMDKSGTQKKDVSRTYQRFDGYTPLTAYRSAQFEARARTLILNFWRLCAPRDPGVRSYARPPAGDTKSMTSLRRSITQGISWITGQKKAKCRPPATPALSRFRFDEQRKATANAEKGPARQIRIHMGRKSHGH